MKTPRKSRRRLLIPLLLVLALLLLYRSNTALQSTAFDLTFPTLPAGFDGCRITVLSDLHGTEQDDLFTAVAAQEPDYILLAGDLLDCVREAPEDYAADTARQLAAIAPVYYVTGNHEWAAADVPALKDTLTACGVTVLSNRYLSLERGGDTIVLAGIDDPNGYADQKTPEELAAELYADRGDPFWVLLAHRNNLFENRYSLLGADLVVSGHGHGGLIRLPGTDGLVSTEHTLFPSYTAGLYEKNGSALFVSRGLGNSGYTFRLFNRPEVATLILHRG